MHPLLRLSGPALALVLSGCPSATLTRPIVRTAMAPPFARASNIEATLRVLDGHPSYIDEAYVAALRHPATVRRFVVNGSQGMADPAFAQLVVGSSLGAPAGLRQTVITALERLPGNPAASQAVLEGVRARDEQVARLLRENPELFGQVITAVLETAARDPETRRALLPTIRRSVRPMMQIVRADRETFQLVSQIVLRGSAPAVTEEPTGSAQSGGGPQ